MKRSKWLLRFATVWALGLSLTFTSGCLTLLLPAVIAYFKSSEDSDEAPETRASQAIMPHTVTYTARVAVNVSAPKAYEAAVVLVRQQRLRILLKDDAVRLLQVTDGVQTASLSALALGNDTCEIAVTASAPGGATVEQDQELALRLVSKVCMRLDVKFTVQRE
jgi:hypothetical protein